MPIALQDLSLGNNFPGLQPESVIRRLASESSLDWRMTCVPRNYPNAPIEVHTISDLQNDAIPYIKSRLIRQSPVLSDLELLVQEERETDAPITPHANQQAAEMLLYVNAILDNAVPELSIAPDGNGGLRIEWFRDNRTLRVLIPSRAEQVPFIYQRINRDSAVHNFSLATVVQALRAVFDNPHNARY